VYFSSTEEQLSDFGLDLNHFFGHEAMRFAMHLLRGFRVRRVAKTKNLPLLFIDPILVVTDPVFVLHFNVLGVGFGDFFRGDAPRDFMNVHVRRHTTFRLAVKREKSTSRRGVKCRSSAAGRAFDRRRNNVRSIAGGWRVVPRSHRYPSRSATDFVESRPELLWKGRAFRE